MKSKICADAMTIRHGSSENENLQREIEHLEETINHLKIENQDMKKETEILKEKAFSLEKQNIYLRNGFENQQEKLESAYRELERTKSLLNTQRQLSRGTSKQRDVVEELKESKNLFDQIPTSDVQFDQNFQNKILGISSSQIKFNELSPEATLADSEIRSMHSKSFRDKSGFRAQSQNQSPNQLDFFERRLQELFDKKKMFESDYSKLPIVVSKSVQWEKKKNFLEAELDTVEKEISSIKRKIKEIKKNNSQY